MKYNKHLAAAAILGGMLGVGAAPATAQDALDLIKARGTLVCPVPTGGLVGFSEIDNNNQWRGLDVDICRAVATAIHGNPQAARFTQVSWAQRFPSLQSGQLDIIVMATGWSLSRDTELVLQFSRPYFVGGIQLLTKTSFNAKAATDLAGATFCTIKGTTGERAVNDYLTAKRVRYTMITFENTAEMREAYLRERCDVQTGWGPSLFVTRLNSPNPAAHVVLSDTINLEALSIAARQGNDKLVDVINWALTALLEADELGITQANVDQALNQQDNPRVMRLLGKTPGIGAKLGLPDDWAYKVIKAVGNYSEIYNRNLGTGSPLGMPAGLNRLWTNGGLLHSLLID
jgi:general L-amino acid transport system substrate-binding protein